MSDLREPVAYQVEIETPTGLYVEHWRAENHHRAIAQVENAKDVGDVARLVPLYAHPPVACSGIGAAWCPVHGDCTCEDRERPDNRCPLHGLESDHGSPSQPEPVGERCESVYNGRRCVLPVGHAESLGVSHAAAWRDGQYRARWQDSVADILPVNDGGDDE